MMIIRTLAMIKPDAVQARNAGKIIDMIGAAGMSVIALKMLHLSRETAAAFYAVHKGKVFYDRLLDFMCSGRSIILVLEGEEAITTWRNLMGATDSTKAAEGTIRKLFGTDNRLNATHGSDSPESAQQEIGFFFSGLEICGEGWTR